MRISNNITENQYMTIIHGSMIAVGILSLAQEVSLKAYQQGWISVIIGGVYPLFIVVSACYIYKKMNYIDFFELNKKLYGNFLAYINISLFLIYLLFILSSVIGGFVNVLNSNIIRFINPYIIIATTVTIFIYSSIGGLSVIGRISEIMFYVGFLLISIFIFFITQGSIINMQPYVSSFKEIFSAVPSSLLTYTGVEISFIIIPFITTKKKLKKSSVLGVLSVVFIYVFTVFITIYYMGWETTSKINRPLIFMLSTLSIPVIEDLQVIFFFLWSTIILRLLTIYNFSNAYCLSKFLKIDYKKGCIICGVLAGALSFIFIPQYNRRMLTDAIVPYMVVGSLVWTIITLILVSFKQRGDKNC